MSQTTAIKEQPTIPQDLNEGQSEAYIKMLEFLEDYRTSDMFLLEGYSGTGKTYIVSKILRYLRDKHRAWNIAVTAPTNKAVKVLMKSSNIVDSKVEFQTIHKLLGLKEQITSDGQQVFTKDGYDTSTIYDFNVVIVDEVSMLNDELFDELQRFSKSHKIIFMGDSAQIPPVGKEDCIPFQVSEREKYDIRRSILTEIMRQAHDNPIIDAGFTLRNDLLVTENPLSVEDRLIENGHGYSFIDFSEVEERNRLDKLLEQYFVSDAFKKDSDHAKVIAWRNKTVAYFNNRIRSLIYGDKKLTKIMVGEKLVANKPVTDKFNAVIFTTNDEFEVVSFKTSSKNYDLEDSSIRLNFYSTTVKYADIKGNIQRRKVDILHEDSEADFEKVLSGMKKSAIKLKGQGYAAKKAWVAYYAFMRQFADVGYNYSITAHRSQGSTYSNTFVMEGDIRANPNIFERNRILYTAYTRAAQRLFVVK